MYLAIGRCATCGNHRTHTSTGVFREPGKTSLRRALPGVPLTYVASPPSAIPIKVNYHYFSLSQGGGAWEAIVRGRNLAAYIPAGLPGPQMELIILLPPEAHAGQDRG